MLKYWISQGAKNWQFFIGFELFKPFLFINFKTASNEKYYDRKNRQFSYADAIHLATALITGCDRLFTGDPDFIGIDENIKLELLIKPHKWIYSIKLVLSFQENFSHL